MARTASYKKQSKPLQGGFSYKVPNIEITEEYALSDNKVVRYDLQFKKPHEGELLYPTAMHTMEHMICDSLKRNTKGKLVALAPKACRTGFLIVMIDPPDDFIETDLRNAFLMCMGTDSVPYGSKETCPNPKYHDIIEAKREISIFLEDFYGLRNGF